MVIDSFYNLLFTTLSEESIDTINLYVTIVGGIFGGLLAIWTIYNGIKILKEKNYDRKIAKITSLLSLLSSEEDYKRLAGARGLSNYIDFVVDEVIIALSIEGTSIVRNELENALLKVNKKFIINILNANKETLNRKSILLGKMITIGMNQDEISARLGFDENVYGFIKKIRHINVEHGKKIQHYKQQRKKIIHQDYSFLEQEKNDVIQEAKVLSQLNDCTGNIISRWILNNKLLFLQNGLDLSETTLYKADLSNSNYKILNILFKKKRLKDMIFSSCNLRHANLSNIIFSNSYFSKSNMYDVNINRCEFIKSPFQNTNFRDSSGIKTKFRDCDLSFALFNMGDYSNSDFCNGNRLYKVKFRGTILNKSNFGDCNLSEVEFHQAVLYQASFKNSVLKGAVMIGAKLISSNLAEAKFYGTDLRGAYIHGADLTGAKFYGANLKGAKIIESELRNAEFKGAIFDANTEIISSNISNATFKKCKGADRIKNCDLQTCDKCEVSLNIDEMNKIIENGKLIGFRCDECTNKWSLEPSGNELDIQNYEELSFGNLDIAISDKPKNN